MSSKPIQRHPVLRRKLAILSACSGGLCLLVPRPMSKLYGLPTSAALLRSIGLRDILVGVLLSDKDRLAGHSLRAASDATDALLIAMEAKRTHRSALLTSARLLVAAASAAVAIASRVSTSPSRAYRQVY